MTSYSDLIAQILDVEWRMFQAVKSASPAACQSAPETFKKVRGSVFEVWSKKMLESYLDDLKLAQETGRNLLAEKYARMDNLIPPLNVNPLISKVVGIEADWQKELEEKYPSLYARTCRGTDPVQNGSNFSIYLKSELETYSDRTVELYYLETKKAYDNKKNLAALALDGLVRKGGYRDIEHAEECLKTTDNS